MDTILSKKGREGDKEVSFGKAYVFAVLFRFYLESALMTFFLVFCFQSTMRVIVMAGQTLTLGYACMLQPPAGTFDIISKNPSDTKPWSIQF